MDHRNEPASLADLESGLRFGHLLISINRHMSREAAALAQSLATLLTEKGIINREELEPQVQAHREQNQGDPQVMLSKAPDKYQCPEQVIIDCASRVPLCRAACCSFRFFLAPQDLDESIVRWDYGNPYWVRQQENGYCYHWNPDGMTCRIHANRPYPCRVYDCRQDKRIWVDFEGRVPNPDLQAGR
jgi:Fe-S-cluster containining protein